MAERFDTVLVANRGEIAVRVMRTAKRLGYRTVAVHSDADANAPHVKAADVAVPIGPAEAAQSYLDIGKVIDAARSAGAGAIHPGYGFLAENAEFAEACATAGIVFIGPGPEAIRAMGDKAEAKRRMEKAGVPQLPGYNGTDQDDALLTSEAERIGFPLMVKAAAGGGGKGMRLVSEPAKLADALAAARREAKAAFGSDVLILERAVLRPRHVEIQVMADTHGNTISLGERDCSVQRRHQKVVEEAPSPAVDAALRAKMGEAAVAAAEAVGYVGAGTVEFLLDESGEFHFLEMNTRLQVEHPVTEMVTGYDLVEQQLRIAQGEALGISQDDVTIDGHAIEVRLYAEDPANDFLPATGRILAWGPASGAGVRVDAGIDSGSEISVHYDPMIAKVIAHGQDRDQARQRLIAALERTTVLGPVTNRAFLAAVLAAPEFAAGEATTAFLDTHMPEPPKPSGGEIAAVAGQLYAERRRPAEAHSPGLAGWSSTGALHTRQELSAGGDPFEVRITESRGGLTVLVGEESHHATLAGGRAAIDGVRGPLALAQAAEGRILAHLPHLDLELTELSALPPSAADAVGEGVITAPMHGSVIEVAAKAGDEVTAGQRLVVLEAMKMEQELVADIDGTVEEIVEAGGQVTADQVLARIVA